MLGGLAALVLLGALVAVFVHGRSGGDTDRTADPSPSGQTVSLLDAGAVGDGTTDDTAAVQAAFDAAVPGETVLVPKGKTFAISNVLTLSSPRVTVSGGGTLLATDEERSSLTLAADGVTLQDVTLTMAGTTRRWDAYEQQRLRLDGHTGITVRDVTVDGSAAAGVYVGGGTSDFLLDGLHVSDTRADGVHITQGAHDGKVVSPDVQSVGDDGVAVVSYRPDGDPCARIEITSPVVDGSSGGRGISVVGGSEITYSDIDVSHTYAAGVYVAAEGSYDSAGASGVTVTGGTVADANEGTDIDHGAVLVYDGAEGQDVSDVTIADLKISDTRASASRWIGLVADGDGSISDVSLLRLALDGHGPKDLFVSNDPGTTYRAEGWTRNGKDVADDDTQGEAAPSGGAVTPSGGGSPSSTGTTAASTTATADAGPTGPTVSVLDLGAAGDGHTDDTKALQAAFDNAAPGETVLLPAGRTFVQSDVLTISSPGIIVAGGGTLLAVDEQRSSLTIAANSVLFRDVTLSIASTTRRWDAYEQQRLRLDGHTGITVRNVQVTGSAAAGIYVGGGTSGFTLDGVRVSGTRADGIHMTQGAHDGRVVSPVVRDVGDDGVAVVSYAADGFPCARITVTSPVVDGSSGGRGVSVVGGSDISYSGITVRNTYAAGIYIAAEGGWNSSAVDGVQVTGGTVTNANDSTALDHGAVLVYNGTADRAVRNVTISGLTLSGLRPSASRWTGLVADSSGAISNAVLSNITLSGSGPGTPFVTNAATTTYRLTGWVRDGVQLPQQARN
jgi:hypothetical protein